jgi:hypothetical protein
MGRSALAVPRASRLDATPEALELARALVARGAIPPRKAADAAHLAVATAHHMQFLLTMTQWHDPIVAEVRRIREQQAAELDYDLKAIFERARRRQKQSKHKTVSFANAAPSEDYPTRAEAKSVRG